MEAGIWSLRDVPGRDVDLSALLEACRHVEEAPARGALVFVCGSASSGRQALLGALADRLMAERGRCVVLSGRFLDGRYVPLVEDQAAVARAVAALERLGAAGEWIAGVLRDVGVPYAGLIAQILGHADKPLTLLEGVANRREPLELAPRLLVRQCAEAPVVCIVDDADLATSAGLWGDLVLFLARRIASSLRLVLILGVDGPDERRP
jgi:hypothetical protein